MSHVHRTMIVMASDQSLAQQLCSGLAGLAGENMFTTPLSANGDEPTTHFISAGMISESFAELMTDASALYAACQSGTIDVTQPQCSALLASSIVSSSQPFPVMAAANLKIVSTPI